MIRVGARIIISVIVRVTARVMVRIRTRCSKINQSWGNNRSEAPPTGLAILLGHQGNTTGVPETAETMGER